MNGNQAPQGFNFIQRPKGKAPVRKNPPFQASQDNFNSLSALTGQGIGVRKNNKFMRNDYYEKVILPKHPTWKRVINKDYDGDKINDIAIVDENGNVKYMNGYSLYKTPKSQYGYIKYLADEGPKKYDETVKGYRSQMNPTKVMLNESVNIINKWVNQAIGNKELIKQKDDAKFKDRLKSLFKRYLLLPYAYALLDYDVDEIKNNDISTLKLYGKKGVKQAIKVDGETLIQTVLNLLERAIHNEINNNVKGFVEGIVNGNTAFAKALFDEATNLGYEVSNQTGTLKSEEEVEEELE